MRVILRPSCQFLPVLLVLTSVGLHPNVIDAAENYVPPIRKIAECHVCRMSSNFSRSILAGLQNRDPANCDSIHRTLACGSLGKEACCALYRVVLNDRLSKKVDCRRYEYVNCRSIGNSECEVFVRQDCIQLDFEDFQEKASTEGYCWMMEDPCAAPFPVWCFTEEFCDDPPGERKEIEAGITFCELYCTKHPKTGKEHLRCGCPYKDKPLS